MLDKEDLLIINEKGFKVKRKVDTGNLGGIYLAVDKDKDVGKEKDGSSAISNSVGKIEEGKEGVILKQINKKDKRYDPDKIANEIQAGVSLHHKNIVKFFDFFESKDSVFLIFEYLEGENLYLVVENHQFLPIDESYVKMIMVQLISALVYCHSLGVVHRDIKLENIILTSDNVVKLIDFGFCDFISNEKPMLKEFLGSRNYTPPEILARSPYDGFKVDVWSTGIVMYTLLFGEFPFSIEELIGSVPPIITWPDSIPKNQYKAVSGLAKSLLLKMLRFNPNKRIEMDIIPKDDWFSNKI